MKNIEKINRRSKGFSLIELLVAISIFALVASAFLALAYRSVAVSVLAKDQLTAHYLVQDAVEYIEMAAENNRLQEKTDWLSGLRDCVGDAQKKCAVDTFNDDSNNYLEDICIDNKCPFIKFSESLNRYGYETGGDWRNSRFVREIKIDEVSGGQELEITVGVSWSSGAIYKETTLYTNLFNFSLVYE